MEILYPRCAGLDVHKETVSVCVLTPGAQAEPDKQIQQFGTTTGELRRLRDWLGANGVTQAAMESTGVYWKPVFNILESACQLILVNARHIKQVPGRKTDKADCAWIASLLRHGLLEASFVPDAEVRQLRDLCRMRTTLVRECVQVGNRLRKVLEDANIKLDSVASNALGVSGRDMILALVQGRNDPAELAELARGRLRAKMPELEQALEGQVTTHHRFLLRELMRQLTFLEGQVARFEEEIDRQMPPFEWAAGLLMTMPGVDRTARLRVNRRDRRRYESFCHFPAFGILGGALPRQQRKRGPAAFGEKPPRQPLDQGPHDRDCLGRHSHQGHLQPDAVPEVSRTSRQETRAGGSSQQSAPSGLAYAEPTSDLQRTRGRIPAAAQSEATGASSDP